MSDLFLKLLNVPTAGNVLRAALEFRGISLLPWIVLAALALGSIVWWTYRRDTAASSISRRALLAGLRGAFLFLLLLLFLRPVIMITIDADTRSTIACLFDGSASMSITDRRTDASDQKRAAIATAGKNTDISRHDLLQA